MVVAEGRARRNRNPCLLIPLANSRVVAESWKWHLVRPVSFDSSPVAPGPDHVRGLGGKSSLELGSLAIVGGAFRFRAVPRLFCQSSSKLLR